MWTYKAGSGLNSTTLGESKQAVDYGPKRVNQFGIAIPELLKFLGLFLEYGKEGFGGLATINLGGQRVVAELFFGLLGILGQSFVEEGFEVGGRGLVTSSIFR